MLQAGTHKRIPKKNGDKHIFVMACLRIFCMKSVHSLCIHYAACMDKYFGGKVQTATDSMICQKSKKARKIAESYRQQGRDRDAHERGRSPKQDAPVRSRPADIRNIADALVRPISPKFGCVCEAAFHCRYYTKFRCKNKERNVKTGMRLWRFCASRFIPAKRLLYQQRIQFFRHPRSDKKDSFRSRKM